MEQTVVGAVERQTSLPVGGLETDEEMDGFLTKREERIVLAEQWRGTSLTQAWRHQLHALQRRTWSVASPGTSGDQLVICTATQVGQLEPDFTHPGVKQERGEMGVGSWYWYIGIARRPKTIIAMLSAFLCFNYRDCSQPTQHQD